MADEEVIESPQTEESTKSPEGKAGAGLRFIKSKSVCRKCRRVGMKLFLKGDRCAGPKCAFSRRSYAPGQHGQKRSRTSDYGRHLLEKQKLAFIYGLKESQLRRLVSKATQFKENTEDKIVELLETRLDSVVYSLGWARSHAEARILIISGHIKVNDRRVDKPGFNVKVKDTVSLSKRAQGLKLYKENILLLAKDKQIPSFLKKKSETEGSLIRLPEFNEVNLFNISLPLVIEFYSR
jgi:small subunit ribosomal protein S4